MACMRVHGKPDLFVTFTANPKWSEILCELTPGQEANDRRDLISRIFKIKLKALIDDIVKNKYFGKVNAHIYVVEWQKRGLPHAHILICPDENDKITTPEQVDITVQAEIQTKKVVN